MNFSVLMSVYAGERADHLDRAFESIFNQTLHPDEVVLVRDGPLTRELDAVIDNYLEKEKNITIVTLKKNQGLGIALNEGIKKCKYDLIARMDSDDIAVPNRFEKQIGYMNDNLDVDLVGSCIVEYDESMGKQTAIRKVPENDQDIKHRMMSRNPINHVTVVYRKSKVLESFGYEDCPYFEDYYLWCKLAQKQAKFHNIQENLVKVRGGDSMITRRGGIKYAFYIILFQWRILKLGVITPVTFLKNATLRSLVSIAPTKLRSLFYSKILREKVD